MTIMRLWKRKRNAAVDDTDNPDCDDLKKEIKTLKKQLISLKKDVDRLEKLIVPVREFASEQTHANKVYIESIERLKNDVNAMKRGEHD